MDNRMGSAVSRVLGRFSPVAPDPALDALGIAYFQTAAELFQSHRYE
jgi:hypothetical protein